MHDTTVRTPSPVQGEGRGEGKRSAPVEPGAWSPTKRKKDAAGREQADLAGVTLKLKPLSLWQVLAHCMQAQECTRLKVSFGCFVQLPV